MKNCGKINKKFRIAVKSLGKYMVKFTDKSSVKLVFLRVKIYSKTSHNLVGWKLIEFWLKFKGF